MKRIVREFGFAVAAWLMPFAASVCLFPLKSSNVALFDTLMGVVLSSSTVVLGCLYLRREGGSYLARGARIGVTWAMANWLFDGLMFSGGPMKMTLKQYVADIGLAYLAIPVITIGLGFAAATSSDRQPQVSG
jgi:hypothetical protein